MLAVLQSARFGPIPETMTRDNPEGHSDREKLAEQEWSEGREDIHEVPAFDGVSHHSG